ncbi:MAG: rhodanese-like domain-containing protein [Candidatus Izemoplasmatales bacterium]|nr:rhodanese-like domain-containing protein [Candidatus Izemoplasmatales bacterium]MDD4069310.1 rhodanese-like domain-containing protein [Candidatus Izemoplasmatales bacterium]MDY0140014.1 rhodanese-like domain-containing protein [Candidatus Izemoplasmatales bacterium]
MFLSDIELSSFILPIVLGISIGLLFALKRNSKNLKVTYLTPEEFRANMRKGQLIDIRIKEEYEKEKINGARNFPKKEALRSLHLLRTDQPVFIYAESDRGLIKSLGRKLLKKGFPVVYVLIGGLENWPYSKK